MPGAKTTGLVRAELNHIADGTRRILKDTEGIFRDAVAYLVHVACDHLDEFDGLGSMQSVTRMEALVHHTDANPFPEYGDFDTVFRDLPSYIRRAAIHAACGHVQSHCTRCSQYYEKRDAALARGWHYRKMEPRFTYTPNACQTLYKKETFKRDGMSVRIKAYVNGTWNWISVSIPWRDYKPLMEAASSGTLMNPKLVYEYHKFYLEFPVKYRGIQVQDTPLMQQKVLSVDRGFNHGAVCSIVDASGSVHGKFFDPFKADMGRIDHVIGLIRKKAASSGKGQSLSSLYTKLEGLKDNYAKQLARWIVDTAIRGGCSGIVLEHLESVKRKSRKKRGPLKARVHHWTTAKIRDLVKGMAYRAGILTYIINPKGTSMYAYDGSGLIERDKDNHSLCTFRGGKRYNADLSASYNIGARYFIRAFKKSMKATLWSELEANVPGLSKRTTWTLDTLRRLQAALAAA